jgi:glycosyltransferase involved in cell wall biosynthesis
MKIALVNDSFSQGRGADQVVYEIANRLGRLHDVDVVCAEADFPENNFKIKRVKAGRLLTGTWRDFLFFKTAWAFRQAARGYDVINLHHATLTPAFWRFKNVVVTYHGSPFILLGESGFRKLARKLVNKLGLIFVKRNKITIAISKYIKNELIKHKVHSEKIVVIYDGVGEEFTPTFKDENFMFFSGRHYKHKRINELIRLTKNFNFKLKIAGSGPETKGLKKLAKDVLAPVEFLGKISLEELLNYYQKCSFFVSTSAWEGFGLIFLEAARCAKPSVAYRIGSIPELIKHDQTGFLADTQQEFKKYVKILIENKAKRKRMGEEALKESQKFDWQESADDYLNLLKNIIGE